MAEFLATAIKRWQRADKKGLAIKYRQWVILEGIVHTGKSTDLISMPKREPLQESRGGSWRRKSNFNSIFESPGHKAAPPVWYLLDPYNQLAFAKWKSGGRGCKHHCCLTFQVPRSRALFRKPNSWVLLWAGIQQRSLWYSVSILENQIAENRKDREDHSWNDGLWDFSKSWCMSPIKWRLSKMVIRWESKWPAKKKVEGNPIRWLYKSVAIRRSITTKG